MSHPHGPVILCVAITGSVPQKRDNPAVPITVAEQIESTREAFEAGASIAHCHVREDDGTPTSDPERFARLKEGIERACPGMIVQLSTGGRSGAGRERGGMIPLRPDMCSLSVGSNNFPTRVYENPPDLVDWLATEMTAHDVVPEIECFDLSHLWQAHALWRAGRLPTAPGASDPARPPYCQFVLGVRNALPAARHAFDAMLSAHRHLFGADAPWCAAGVGRHQAEVGDWAAAEGGHVRTGLEDNVRLDRERLAPSNAALVRRAAETAARHGRPIATPAEARAILGLRAA
ncbi:3-keto-5-aminohexanoate cleavage protein [Jannaschia sp. W003]|uniref:3-keto-5-aminohexanoate cleavage protein n=1 Tax=Jannaschia sp. W003 TaxID=2867012 RepID=UPI0021A63AF7|nr:3-keto-5-aminohexanoate cleavage protein [Jannaschia sp. W003]UWQ22112.1 3-keto-5-aminohexanoate cleavage protein [Jannaschia sp. W003]